MPAVLVHGVPETAELWEDLRPHLGRNDVVALSLPGFGCERPGGFEATMDAYAEWLIGQLERIKAHEGPIDLVCHDWGGGLVVRAVSLRADLVRSWVSDAAGLGDHEFEWHEFAKIWQTPEAGEQFWEGMLAASPEDRGSAIEGSGVPHDKAVAVAAEVDETMAQCILSLYRSAINVGADWGPAFADIAKPGMVLVPELDAFLNADHARRAAQRAGAQVQELAGLGHWWMLQDPAGTGALLRDFWASLG